MIRRRSSPGGQRGRLPAFWAAAALGAALPAAAPAAIVECIDAHGVAVLTSSTSGDACNAGRAAATRRNGRPVASASAPTASPAAFPRVSADAQRERDSDRARILRDELDQEEQRLTRLETTSGSGARPVTTAGQSASAPGATASSMGPAAAEVAAQLARTSENIRALQRELAGAR